MDVVLKNMTRSGSAWILEHFDAGWNYLPGNPDLINIGHNLKVAWLLMRLALIDPDTAYQDKASEISALLDKWGFDKETGLWYAAVSKDDREKIPGFPTGGYKHMEICFHWSVTGCQEKHLH